MKAILWARVSDPRRGKEESEAAYTARIQQDVENQLIPLRATSERLGWDVVREWVAKGTAWNKDPPEKAELIEFMIAGGADLVATWRMDRWSRKGAYGSLQEIVELERHHGLKFYSLNESFLSTATLDEGLRHSLIALFAWLAEEESRKRSERVKAAAAAKQARTGNIGQNPRWGRGKIPSEADKARMRELRKQQGLSLAAVATETGYSRSTVYRALRNEM